MMYEFQDCLNRDNYKIILIAHDSTIYYIENKILGKW